MRNNSKNANIRLGGNPPDWRGGPQRIRRNVRVSWGWVLATLIAISWTGQVSAQEPISFAIPQGWTDISPGTPAADLDGVPDEVAAFSENKTYKTIAIDQRPSSPTEGAVMLGTTTAGKQRIDKEALDAIAATTRGELTKNGAAVEFLEVDTIELHDAEVGRLVFAVTGADYDEKQIAFVFPGHNEVGVLAFVATPEVFDAQRWRFEAAARTTRGTIVRHSKSWRWTPAFFLVIALVVWWRRRTRSLASRDASES